MKPKKKILVLFFLFFFFSLQENLKYIYILYELVLNNFTIWIGRTLLLYQSLIINILITSTQNMSAVFEFDDLPQPSVLISLNDEEITESGYSSEVDTTEPRQIQLDEKLYEVPLDENFISSSLKTTPSAINQQLKVCLDDFEILKLLGRGA